MFCQLLVLSTYSLGIVDGVRASAKAQTSTPPHTAQFAPTMSTTCPSYRTLFPHEPEPPTSALHLQGAFVPKRHAEAIITPVTDNEAPSTKCQCSSPAFIEMTLLSSLTSMMAGFEMYTSSIEMVSVIQSGGTDEDVSKVRITLVNSSETRQLVDRLKRRDFTPLDFMCSNGSSHSGCCPDCGARYGGRPIQITHVSPHLSSEDATTNKCGEDTIRWARAAPPKFQRIINAENVEQMELRRNATRFVYVENVSGWKVDIDSPSTHDNANQTAGMKECLFYILSGDPAPLEKVMSNSASNGTARDSHWKLTPSDVQDDIRRSFQMGLRQSISSFDSSKLSVELFMKSDTSQKKKNGLRTGHFLYNAFHFGMRSHEDAARLIQELQGVTMEIDMVLPSTFVSLFLNDNDADVDKTTFHVTITMDKLFLDYADVLLPKRIRSQQQPDLTPGLPSRSECTSTTSHIYIPGLHLIPDYVSTEEEAVLLAVLTGPEAPWAPAQFTPSGGQIKRRVQHYGYVFDYVSADVLRRDVESDTRGEASCCPPLPAVDCLEEALEECIAHRVTERRGWEVLAGVIERTRRFDFGDLIKTHLGLDEQVNGMSLRSENTMMSKADLQVDSKMAARSEGNNQTIQQCSSTYPNINQLTINEYTPGQGIGSHVDTETAFDDGLLIITLNGGIVMEFRRVGQDLKKLVYLPPRSLILLSGDARYKWEHMIVSRTTDTVDGEVIPRTLRVSLTLRTALTAPVEGEQATPLNRFESTVFPPYWGQTSDAGAVKGTDSSAIKKSDLITPETESRHVHAVYEAIATQWHHTRGKRGVLWPGATQFLENLPPGSVVADVGCGDGKYFSTILGADSYVIGTDISEALLRTASSAEKTGSASDGKAVEGPQYQLLPDDKHALSLNPAVAVADCIHLPIRTNSCDAAICIAVMHHLSTVGRRLRCLTELARVVKVGGLINVQAWALEQEGDSKRKFHGADVLVPFNAQPKYLQASMPTNDDIASNTCKASGGKGVAQMISESFDGAEFDSKKNLVVFQRYCHMYRLGELEELVSQIPSLELMDSAYEKGNHVVLLRVCAPVNNKVD